MTFQDSTSPQPGARFDTRLTRRQFLGWGATLGAGLAAGVPWPAEGRPIGLGVVGLGDRGRRVLDRIVGAPGVRLVGVCDRRRPALGRAAGLSTDLVRSTRVAALCAAPGVDAVVATVPMAALPEMVATARAADKPILLARPLGDLDALVGEGASNRVELVPSLHLSLGATPREVESADAARLELTVPTRAELDVLAAEGLELAMTLLGGVPTEIRTFGGPARGPVATAWRAAVRLDATDRGSSGPASRRLDVALRVVPGVRSAGRLAVEADGRAVVGGLVQRLDPTPTSDDLAALAAAGAGAEPIGLELNRLARGRELYRQILSGAEAGPPAA